MKTAIKILVGFILCFVAVGDPAKGAIRVPGSRPPSHTNLGGGKPTNDALRTLDGKTVIHVWRMWEFPDVNSRPLTAWHWITGTVLT